MIIKQKNTTPGKTAIFLWKILKFFRTGPLMLFIHPKSALLKTGWFRSFHSQRVIDKNGNDIPWWTYPFIDFIDERLNKRLRVLEFGCGGSTIWLNRRVKEIVSVENNSAWAEVIKKKIGSGVNIISVEEIEDIKSYIHRIEGLFDIIIIDNQGNRMKCAINSIPLLNNGGVVIWDNTDGDDWPAIKQFFSQMNFFEISFSGMVAQELSLSRTTLFYRQDNCLYI
jgi:hypothetical protein